MLNELKVNLEKDLDKKIISSQILLDNLALLNEQSRKTSAYVDPNHIPFYYYLGKYYKPKNLIEINTGAALNSCSFFKSCKTIENFLAFQSKEEEFYSSRFALKNINKNYKNNLKLIHCSLKNEDFHKEIESKEWDLMFINENSFSYDDLLFLMSKTWMNFSTNGLFIVNYLNNNLIKSCFENFCKIKNSEYVVLNTRYTLGIIKKD